jgi:transketolase
VVEPFAEEFPDRFLNAGVAEQNMTGMAAGLASEGYHVFTYSIANFSTLRCLEQVRNDICYHNLPVTIVSVGGGVAYGNLGYSHHAVEDLAVMRALPNLAVCAPGDAAEVNLLLPALCARAGPSYLRLGKAGEPKIHATPPRGFRFGQAINLGQGTHVSLFCTGGILAVAVAARDLLERDGITVDLWSVPTLKPIDESALLQSARTTRVVVTLEEHGSGGLGSIVAELLLGQVAMDGFLACRMGEAELNGLVGSQDYLRERVALSPEKVAAGSERVTTSRVFRAMSSS